MGEGQKPPGGNAHGTGGNTYNSEYKSGIQAHSMFPSGDIVGKAYRFVVNTIVHVRHVGFVNRFVHIQGLRGHAQHAARHTGSKVCGPCKRGRLTIA